RPLSVVLLSSRSASQLRALTARVVLLAGRLGHRSHTLTTRSLHRQTFNPRGFSIELIELGLGGGVTGLSLLLQLIGVGIQLLLGAVLAQGVLCAGRHIGHHSGAPRRRRFPTTVEDPTGVLERRLHLMIGQTLTDTFGQLTHRLGVRSLVDDAVGEDASMTR